MKKDIILSILIPVYNAEKYLARCLESIISQSLFCDKVEIVAINDGSKDTSLEILNEFTKKNNQIHVISRENKGIGLTRNELLENAQGEYFWFVDADDFVTKNSLSIILPLLEGGLYDMLLISYFWGTEKNGQNIIYSGEFVSGYELTQNNIYNNSIWTRVYKTELIRKNGIHFMDYQMGEDFDFIFKTIPHIGAIKCIELPLYNYIINPGSAITSASMEHKMKASEDSISCMEINYMWLSHYSNNEQMILRKPLNHFLMGYLYSIIVVPFSYNYKVKAIERLKGFQAIPVYPLPIGIKKKLLCFILNNSFYRKIFLFIDFLILKIKK